MILNFGNGLIMFMLGHQTVCICFPQICYSFGCKLFRYVSRLLKYPVLKNSFCKSQINYYLIWQSFNVFCCDYGYDSIWQISSRLLTLTLWLFQKIEIVNWYHFFTNKDGGCLVPFYTLLILKTIFIAQNFPFINISNVLLKIIKWNKNYDTLLAHFTFLQPYTSSLLF